MEKHTGPDGNTPGEGGTPTEGRHVTIEPGIRHGPHGDEGGRLYAEAIVDTLREALLVLTPDLRVRTANAWFYETFGVGREETEGRLLYEVGNGQWDVPELRRLLEDVLPHDRVVEDYEVTHTFERLGERTMLVNARRLDHVHLLLLAFEDVTERRRAERALRALNEALEARVAERTAALEAESRRAGALADALTLAEQSERHRIAQVLHDDLQQQLYAASMLLGLHLEAGSPEEARSLAERAAVLLEQATALTRSLAVELSPPALADERVGEILQWLAERKKRLYGLEVAVEVDEACVVRDRDTRVLLYRTVGEALFNVVKHGDTSRARVRAWEEGAEVVVEVADEGAGFEVAPRSSGRGGGATGFGLRSIEQRVSLVGGRLEVDSAPGRGTRVTLAVPAQRAPAAGAPE